MAAPTSFFTLPSRLLFRMNHRITWEKLTRGDIRTVAFGYFVFIHLLLLYSFFMR